MKHAYELSFVFQQSILFISEDSRSGLNYVYRVHEQLISNMNGWRPARTGKSL